MNVELDLISIAIDRIEEKDLHNLF